MSADGFTSSKVALKLNTYMGSFWLWPVRGASNPWLSDFVINISNATPQSTQLLPPQIKARKLRSQVRIPAKIRMIKNLIGALEELLLEAPLSPVVIDRVVIRKLPSLEQRSRRRCWSCCWGCCRCRCCRCWDVVKVGPLNEVIFCSFT